MSVHRGSENRRCTTKVLSTFSPDFGLIFKIILPLDLAENTQQNDSFKMFKVSWYLQKFSWEVFHDFRNSSACRLWNQEKMWSGWILTITGCLPKMWTKVWQLIPVHIFAKYWPIFGTFSTLKSAENFEWNDWKKFRKIWKKAWLPTFVHKNYLFLSDVDQLLMWTEKTLQKKFKNF